MKYVPSAMIGQLSRSAGSTTASRNRFGSYLRNRVQPMNPNTARQSDVRATLSGASSGWRLLTQAQRDGWTTLGSQMTRVDSLGQTYTLTGLQAYTAQYINAATIGQGGISDAPAMSTPPTPVDLAVVLDSSPADVATVAVASVPVGHYLVIEMTAPISVGRNFVPRGAYKLIATQDDTYAAPIDVLAAYEAIYGELTGGGKVFTRAKLISTFDYQASPWVSVSTVVQ